MKYAHLNENERFAIDLYFNYENKSIISHRKNFES